MVMMSITRSATARPLHVFFPIVEIEIESLIELRRRRPV